MYCYHCGKRINEHKVEAKENSFAIKDESISFAEDATVSYICPRCGHLIRHELDEESKKELSRASHAQIQRANNSFARGMCMNALGLILLLIAIVFFILANKPAQGFKLVTTCAEFYVFIGAISLSVILLGFGIVLTVRGVMTKKHYSDLLKDLNNKTFVNN